MVAVADDTDAGARVEVEVVVALVGLCRKGLSRAWGLIRSHGEPLKRGFAGTLTYLIM